MTRIASFFSKSKSWIHKFQSSSYQRDQDGRSDVSMEKKSGGDPFFFCFLFFVFFCFFGGNKKWDNGGEWDSMARVFLLVSFPRSGVLRWRIGRSKMKAVRSRMASHPNENERNLLRMMMMMMMMMIIPCVRLGFCFCCRFTEREMEWEASTAGDGRRVFGWTTLRDGQKKCNSKNVSHSILSKLRQRKTEYSEVGSIIIIIIIIDSEKLGDHEPKTATLDQPLRNDFHAFEIFLSQQVSNKGMSSSTASWNEAVNEQIRWFFFLKWTSFR